MSKSETKSIVMLIFYYQRVDFGARECAIISCSGYSS